VPHACGAVRVAQVQTLVGELAERLNLPGNSKQAYVNSRDKRVAREVCVLGES
jgi:hypothetical protein